MTGAAIPPGADAVVRSEDSRREGNKVKILARAAAGLNIRRAGESVRRGETVLGRGKVIRPQEIGLLAALGIRAVKVVPGPRVALISTGNELKPLGGTLAPGMIFDCNRHSLSALVVKYGGVPVPLGIVPDREKAIREALLKARDCDLVLTSGGVSVGEFDLVKKALKDSGGKIAVWRIAMKPGKPLTFGSIAGRPFFGLPGNPVSAIVSFLLFVRPALLALQEKESGGLPEEKATLEEDFSELSDRTQYVRSVAVRRGGRLYARPTGPQGSGILKSLVLANALLIVPPGRRLKKGARVRALLLD
jgi:molybdopterin molybdotransferase